jgi:hypothetical protein
VHSVPHGIYNFKVIATGFRSAEIRNVHVNAAAITLPSVPLEFGLIADCGTAPGPTYYRVSAGPEGLGAIAGVILDDKAMPVQGATVTLYMKDRGRVRSQRTNAAGAFSFAGLQMQTEEYWVSIERDGFFVEEVRHLFVVPGFEAVYSQITMESCSPGRCQPHLKTVHVMPSCA